MAILFSNFDNCTIAIVDISNVLFKIVNTDVLTIFWSQVKLFANDFHKWCSGWP